MTTLLVLGLLYASRNLFGGEVANGSMPDTPPLPPVQQNSYWNENFGYGFRGENNDLYQSKSFSGVDVVAVDSKEGVLFKDAKVKVSFYSSASIEEIEKMHPIQGDRSYSKLNNGIAVIEGDLDSPSAKTILATLHAR